MRAFVATLFVLILITGPAIAQDEPAWEATDQVAPNAYPLERLRAEVVPLYLDEVTQVADMWKAHLRSAASHVESLRLEEAAASEIAQAEAERNAVAERLAMVVTNLEAKGGEGDTYRDYIAATSGVSVDWFDPAAVTEYFTAWIVSPDGGIEVGLNIVKFVVIFVIAWIIAKVVSGIASTAVRRLPKTSSLLQDFVVTVTRRTVLLIGIVVALGALGLNVTPLVAAIGAAGLVIGLALQGTLSNFASGILILIYRPFDVGDAVKVGSVSGKVEAMNLVQTTVLTWDNQIQYVPNNEIWDSVITNINGRDVRRVDMVFGIGYGDDMAKAESVIRRVIEGHELILAEPAPTIKVNELADSSVNFVVRPWVKNADYWTVYWDLMRQVKENFDTEGVGIPFPQRDIHLPESLRVVVTNE